MQVLNIKTSLSLVAIFFLAFLVAPWFIPADYCNSLIKEEQTYLTNSIGYDSAVLIHEKAKARYRKTFIDSGIYGSVHHFFIPTEEERKKSKGLEDFGQPVFKFIKTQLDVSMMLAYLFFFKILIFMQYFWFIVLFLIPAAFCRYLSIKEKASHLKLFSPTMYRFAILGLIFMIILFLGMFIVPIAIKPVVFPLTVMAIGGLISLSYVYLH